jgi:polysaccharide pyruvyl transferase WcaK-like protein
MLIEDSDMILLNGGNLLRGKSIVDYARIFALFYPFKIASKYKRKMIILPQSTASSSKLGMKLLKKKLLNFNIVFIRESNSFEVLNKEIKDVNFVKTTDVAFYISDNPIALAKYKEKYTEITPVNKKNIALILRSTTIGDLGEFDNDKKESMALNIINHIKEFNESYNIFLVVQTLKDKKFTEYIANKIEEKNRPIIIEEYDTFVLREIYKNMEFVIAMRLHAAILSMTSRTPVIGYFDREWGFKNPGIMNDVGLPWTEDGKKLIELSNKVITEKVKFVNLINEFIIKEKSKISNYI